MAVKVLIVDDSSFMRKVLKNIISEMTGFEVVGEAVNGLEAISMARELKPNMITMDIQMPEMDGLDALMKILSEKPIPVIMVSGTDKLSASIVSDALMIGAVDFIPKPQGFMHSTLDEFSEIVKQKLKNALEIKIKTIKDYSLSMKLVRRQRDILSLPKDKVRGCVVIGSSTGGPMTVMKLVAKLKNKSPVAYIFVQHMPETFTKSFAERLSMHSLVSIKEAEEKDIMLSGYGYVAPGGYHLRLKKIGESVKIVLGNDDKVHGVRPAVDVSLIAASEIFGKNCLSVILTGMGNDGTEGSVEVKKNGGVVISQNKETSVIYGMPKSVFEAGVVDHVLPIDEIAEKIDSIISRW